MTYQFLSIFLLLIYKLETGPGWELESDANKVLISEMTAYYSNEPIKERI